MDSEVLDVRHADSALIDRMGGTVAVARLCDVRPQAVTQWRRAGIPHPRRMYLSLLRPDVAQKDEPVHDAAS